MLRNITVLFSARVFTRVLGLLSTLIVARMLTPEDYGVIAACMIVQDLAARMQKIGINENIISKRNVNDGFLASAITLRIALALSLSLTVHFTAELTGRFLENENVADVLQVICWLFFVASLTNPNLILNAKAENFVPEIKTNIASKLFGVIVTITLAFSLRSYWALAFGMTATSVAYLACSYVFSKPKLRLGVNKRSVFEIAHFSKWILLSSWIGWINANLGRVVWSKVFGASYLGLVAMAHNLFSIFETEVSAALEKANLSNLSRSLKQSSSASMRSELVVANLNDLQDIRQAIVVPVYAVVMCCPALIVGLLLGPSWTQVAELAPFVAMSLIAMSYSKTLTSIVIALRQPGLMVLNNVLICILIIVYSALAWKHDNYYFLLVGGALTHFLAYFVLCFHVSKLLEARFSLVCRKIDVWQIVKVACLLVAKHSLPVGEREFALVAFPLLAASFYVEYKLKANFLIDRLLLIGRETFERYAEK